VLVPRLLAVLDPDTGNRERLPSSSQIGASASGSSATGSGMQGMGGSAARLGGERRPMVSSSMGSSTPVGSARSVGSGRATPSPGYGANVGGTNGPSSSRGPNASSSSSAAPAGNGGGGGGRDVDPEECTPFDLLHTEKGFVAFEHWYRRALSTSSASGMPATPRPEVGLLWPQVFCPPNALHEHAFIELMRAFADCTDSEALDFFDLLDHDFHGTLGLPQVYIAICLVAALGCRQLTKFIYFHSTRLFGILAKGCRFSAAPNRVTWARLMMLLRLLGTPGHLISKVCVEHGMTPLAQLKYDDFLDIIFPIMVQLDRGTDIGEITVINEHDRTATVRSKMCTLL